MDLSLSQALPSSIISYGSSPPTHSRREVSDKFTAQGLLNFFLDVMSEHIVHGLHHFGLLDLLQLVDVLHAQHYFTHIG
jgi:hypothetical protein